MRKWLILAALGAVLIVLNRLAPIVDAWHYVVPATPGEVLYAATFDDAAADWELYEGRLAAQLAAGALRITVDEVDKSPYSASTLYFSDFDLRVQSKAVAGPLDNGYGVVFRVQDPNNYYLFLISSDGYYQVRRRVSGEEKLLSDWVPSAIVKQGLDVVNEIRVLAQGAAFHFYVNGELVELCIPDDPNAISTYADRCIDGQMLPELVDDSIAAGQIGVVAVTPQFGEPGVEVDFDNVLVLGPVSE